MILVRNPVTEIELTETFHTVRTDVSLAPVERFRTAGVVAKGTEIRMDSFDMSLRDAATQTGTNVKPIHKWIHEQLPNAYIDVTVSSQIVRQVRHSTGEIFLKPGTSWNVTLSSRENLITPYLSSAIIEFEQWAGHPARHDRPLLHPGHNCWSMRGHNSWAVWSALVDHGPLTTSELVDASGVSRRAVNTSVKDSLTSSGFVELSPHKDKSYIWIPKMGTDDGSDVLSRRRKRFSEESSSFTKNTRPHVVTHGSVVEE